MADVSALDTLTKNVADIQTKISDLIAKITTLNQNALFNQQQNYLTTNGVTNVNSLSTTLAFPGNALQPTGSGGGVIVPSGVNSYNSIVQQIKDAQTQLDDLQNNQLPVAQKALNDLNAQEAANPTVIATQAAIKNQQDLQAKNYAEHTLLYEILGGILVLGMLIGTAIYLVRKHKKASA